MDHRTPYAVVTAIEPPRPVTKRQLVRLSRQLELAAMAGPPGTIAATLQDARFLTDRTRDVYCRLAAAGAAVTLLARGLQSWLAPGVRGVDLAEDDPLVDEWVVVLHAGELPSVLVATDLHRAGAVDLERDFAYATSRDPEVVAACADLLAGSRAG